MKLKTSLFLFLFSSSAYAVDCNKHPIYCQIKKNSPKIKKKHAMRISNIIYKMQGKYKIPARIFAAILRQESNYTLKINGCHKGLILPDCQKLEGPESIRVKCEMNKDEFTKEVKICSDFGISQIYYRTARRFGIDINKLTTDLAYSIEAGARVLADFKKRYGKKDEYWWLRYNCGTRSTTNRDTCQIYKKLVERYL
tara:strand:+ start:5750 stop:6340 length:591 start_codon:yes stop_codon:yes gene_type:complete